MGSAKTPEDLFNDMVHAIIDRDNAAFIDSYEPGAIVAAPEGDIIGSESIGKTFSEYAKTNPKFVLLEKRISESGSTALLRAHWRVVEESGEAFEVHPVALARKQDDGTWKIAIDSPGKRVPAGVVVER